MKRLSMNGLVKPIIRKKDESYLYTANPSAIHPNSNKINHQLKLLDYYIEAKQPSQCVIEPILGKYEPDLLYRDEMNRSICVEIQLTKISKKRMQEKINNFIEEYGTNHDAKILYICTHISYKDLKTKQGFKVIQRNVPKEIVF